MPLAAIAAGAPSPPDLDDRFRALFEAEFDYVWASLRRLGVRADDVEDVAQDVFVQVYRKIDRYDAARPIRPWLFAFAVRSAADWRRLARHKIEVLGVETDVTSDTPSAEDLLANRQDMELVLRALEVIPDRRRSIFILHELDGCAMREIAVALGIPLFTSYSRLRLAREEFTVAMRRLMARRRGPG
jgi:RNA polymerase sigma-70 factor (ECF subfamily)